MTVVIRQATQDDAAVVSLLNADVQAFHAAAFPERFKPVGPDTFPPSAASAILASPDNVVLIADIAGQPAGYVYAEIVRRAETSLTYAFGMIYIHHLSVRSEFRRQSVGTRLLAAIREAARLRGIERVALDVWSFNGGASEFFKRNGFAAFNERLWQDAL